MASSRLPCQKLIPVLLSSDPVFLSDRSRRFVWCRSSSKVPVSPVTYHWKKKAALASETETTLEKMFISNPCVGSVEEKDHAGGFASFPSCRHPVVVKHDRRIARSAIKWSLQNIGILRTKNSSGVASSLSALYRCWPPAVNLGYSISPFVWYWTHHTVVEIRYD